MKIGIVGTAYGKQPGYVDYALMKKHGYDACDYQGFLNVKNGLFDLSDEEFEAKIKEEYAAAEKFGIEMYQVHGPWETDHSTEQGRADTMRWFKRAVIGTALLHSKYLIAHPIMPNFDYDRDVELVHKLNVDFFTELCNFAKPHGVTICIENMPFLGLKLSSIQSMADFVDELGLDNFKICLDTGHNNLFKISAGDAVRICGSRLAALHIHDNKGYIDAHLPMFIGIINWADFSKALYEIDYKGVFSLESFFNTASMPGPVLTEQKALIAKVAKHIANLN